MKKLVSFLAAMLLVTASNAAMFLAIPADGVKVFVDNKLECTGVAAEKLAAMKPPADMQWFAAVVDDHGKVWHACASEYQGNILLVYEDGDIGAIPTQMFHMVHDA